jgi:hypothetical protein
MAVDDPELITWMQTVAVGDASTALRLLAASQGLANERANHDAYLKGIEHYCYAGDSALHIAAAAYHREIALRLIALGADVHARNRRGAQPLHYAADGIPGSRSWNPPAQAATIACLIEAGSDPNAVDMGGVTPLHRAVRTRCAAAVKALLERGADPRVRNRSGSTPKDLATRSTGRGGSGSPDAKAQQQEIVSLLARRGRIR